MTISCVCNEKCTKHTKHSFYAEKSLKLHVFDIVGQSASENTFFDGNMTISCLCKDTCTKLTKHIVYAPKPRKSHVFNSVHYGASKKTFLEWIMTISCDTCIEHRKTCENTLFCVYTPNHANRMFLTLFTKVNKKTRFWNELWPFRVCARIHTYNIAKRLKAHCSALHSKHSDYAGKNKNNTANRMFST